MVAWSKIKMEGICRTVQSLLLKLSCTCTLSRSENVSRTRSNILSARHVIFSVNRSWRWQSICLWRSSCVYLQGRSQDIHEPSHWNWAVFAFLRNQRVSPLFVTCLGKQAALTRCGAHMNHNIRDRSNKLQVYWKCTSSKYNTARSVQSSTSFLTFKDRSSKCLSSLRMSKIMKMLYLFIHTLSTFEMSSEMTSLSRSTVCD